MKMSLDSSGVKRGLAKASASIRNFSSQAMERLGAVARLASIGLVAAFVAFSKKAIDLGSQLSDIAISTGFATEQFQVFRGALIDAGGKAESMEKAINNMQKAVVQGGEGMTTFTRAFDRIGLSAETLRNLSPEEQFQTIGKAIAGAADQQGAYTSAMEIFGTKVAPRMMEVFKRLSSDGYSKMADEIRETYGIMDAQTQASLDKAADRIEQFKQKVTIRVGQLISGANSHAAIKEFGTRFLIEISHIKENLLNAIIDAAIAFPRGVMAGLDTIRSKMMGDATTFAEHYAHIVEQTKDLDQFKGVFDDSENRKVLTETANTYAGLNTLAAKRNTTERGTSDVLDEQAERLQRQQNNAIALAEAKASGDQNMIQLANKRISKEARINALKKATKLGDEEVLRIVEQQIEQEQKKKALQTDLINAQISGNTKAITAAEKKIALEEKALEIAEKTGEEFHDAVILAERVLQHEAGPDLNQSGFVTRKEQREFDRQQKEIAKQNKKDQHEEKMKEMREGGSLRNVSKQKREELQNKIKERKLNERQDKEKQRKLEDQARRERLDPRRKQERLKQEKAQEEEKKRGAERKAAAKKAEEQQKQVDNNPVVKGLKPVLDKQLTELVKINKALNCEG